MSAPETNTSPAYAYEPIRLVEIVSYSLGDAGINLYWAPITAFLMIYLTDIVGLPVARIATLMVVMRLVGAIVEPVFAAIADRTQTAYGRYRPWFLWLALPLAAAGVAIFSTAGTSQQNRLVAVYITLILFNLIYSAAGVAYNALSGVITPDASQRDTLLSVRYGSAFLGAVLVTWITPKIVQWAGRGDVALGWEFTMTMYGVVAVAFFIVLFLNTRERFALTSQPRANPLQDIADLFGNRPWLVLFALGVVVTIAYMLHTSASPYVIKYVAGRQDLVGAFIMTFYLGLAAGSAICALLTRWARRQVWIAIMLGVTAFCGLAFSLCPPHALIWMFALQTVSGLAFGTVSTLTFAMYADAADYNAWKHDYRATAMTFSMINVGKKVGAALAGAAFGWLLSAHGYIANAAPAGALVQMRLLIGPLPAGFCLLGIAVVALYDLSPEKVARLQAQWLGRLNW